MRTPTHMKRHWVAAGLSIALFCSGCAGHYRHYEVQPAAGHLLTAGASVSLRLKNGTIIQGTVMSAATDSLILRPLESPAYVTFGRVIPQASPRPDSADSLVVRLSDVHSSATLVPYNPSKKWGNPYAELVGGIIGFGIGAALMGLLWWLL